MIKCLELPNFEVKKLIYLYIINNSRLVPDDALMIVNQLCKDARDKRPLVKALALRTMGCIRVAKLNEYIIEPLLEGLQDASPYVRKTAVLCAAKISEVSRELVVARDLPAVLRGTLANDANPSVVAAAVIALKEISTNLAEKFILTAAELLRVIKLCDTFSDWEQVDVFDILAVTQIKEQLDEKKMIELLKDKLFPKLFHNNTALVLSSAKLLLSFAERLNIESAEVEKIVAKVFKCFTSLLSVSDEQTFVVCNAFILLDRLAPNLHTDPASFYCRQEEALYVKMLKLKIIKKLAKR